MLLPYKLGEFTIAPSRLLRQTRARPLDQGEVVLVDRGRWYLGRTRLMGRGLLVSNEGAHLGLCRNIIPPWKGLP